MVASSAVETSPVALSLERRLPLVAKNSGVYGFAGTATMARSSANMAPTLHKSTFSSKGAPTSSSGGRQ